VKKSSIKRNQFTVFAHKYSIISSFEMCLGTIQTLKDEWNCDSFRCVSFYIVLRGSVRLQFHSFLL